MLSTPRSLADTDGSMTPMTMLPAAAITAHDDPEWTTGDFEVITSDCRRFRVPSYYLLAASPLFHPHANDALSITFTDPTETSTIFRLVLYLLTKGRLGSGDAWHVKNLQSLASFLRRWEMEASLANFITHFEARVRNRDQAVLGLPGFLVGAYADSIEACVATLRIPSVEWDGRRGPPASPNGAPSSGLGLHPPNEDKWASFRPERDHERDPWSEARRKRRPTNSAAPTPDPSLLVSGARGRPTFDPSSWPLETFTVGHPPTYLFALARAWGSAGAEDAARLPTEFVAFLQAAKAASV